MKALELSTAGQFIFYERDDWPIFSIVLVLFNIQLLQNFHVMFKKTEPAFYRI